MLKGPLAPNLYEMQLAWALLRVCVGDPRFVGYLPDEQAEVIGFFRYEDFEPTGDRPGAGNPQSVRKEPRSPTFGGTEHGARRVSARYRAWQPGGLGGRGAIYYHTNDKGEKGLPVFSTPEGAKSYGRANFNTPGAHMDML